MVRLLHQRCPLLQLLFLILEVDMKLLIVDNDVEIGGERVAG